MEINLNNNQQSIENFIGFNNKVLHYINKTGQLLRSFYKIPIKIVVYFLTLVLVLVLMIPGYFFALYWIKKAKKQLSQVKEILPYIPLSELHKLKSILTDSQLLNHFKEIISELEKTSALFPLQVALIGFASEIETLETIIDNQIKNDIDLFAQALNNSEPINYSFE
jgi:hypothetical protein